MFTEVVAVTCLVWYVFIAIVCTIGTIQIFRNYTRPPPKPISSYLPSNQIPHVTIIRPCKGIEPFLYECLASTFTQDYPADKQTVYFCVSTRQDAALPTIQRLLRDYPERDARVFVEDEDPALAVRSGNNSNGNSNGGGMGPNPKIRNMSRAYREAKGDLVWILDCNIWVGWGACGRMVDKLCGFVADAKQKGKGRPYKLVAHLPVCVVVDDDDDDGENTDMRGGSQRGRTGTETGSYDNTSTVPFLSRSTIVSVDNTTDTNNTPSSSSSRSPSSSKETTTQNPTGTKGGLLEESFLTTAHAKMYVAINTVGIAPCINGKSTIFRRSHLNYLTKNQGIDFFSHNICEDHLIGDLLWKSDIPPLLDLSSTARNDGDGNGNSDNNGDGRSDENVNDNVNEEDEEERERRKSNPHRLKFGRHGFALHDPAIQPISGMSVAAYTARRVRWLRVRKFTVPAATLVEPGTESLLCSAYGAFGATTSTYTKSVFGGRWIDFWFWWLLSVSMWCIVDFFVSRCLLNWGSVERVKRTGDQEQQQQQQHSQRSQQDNENEDESEGHENRNEQQQIQNKTDIPPFIRHQSRRLRFISVWFASWIGREFLALLIWTWAIWGGTTVTWRDKKLWVGMDMRVHEMDSSSPSSSTSAATASSMLSTSNTLSKASDGEDGRRGSASRYNNTLASSSSSMNGHASGTANRKQRED